MPPASTNSPEPGTRFSEDHSDDPHYHLVKADDCILSLADAEGFFWKAVWNHPKNSTIRELRKKPTCLRVGDWVYIPDLTIKEESGATEKRHRFRRLGVPAYLHVRLMRDHQPRANLEYRLIIEGRSLSGKTNADGEIHQPIPPGARQGVLRTREGDRWSQVRIKLGELDPNKHNSGARARLANLGYGPGSEEDEEGEENLCAATRTFQEREGLEVTGELDEPTLSHLEKLHDRAENHKAADRKKEQSNTSWKVHPDLSLRGDDMFDDPFVDDNGPDESSDETQNEDKPA